MTDPSSLASIVPLVAQVANDEAGPRPAPAQPQPAEWVRLAWAMAAEDLGTDVPEFTGNADDDDETDRWREWAQRTWGGQARAFIAAHDALGEIRFGPIPAAVDTVDRDAEISRLKAELRAPLPAPTVATYRIHPSQIDQVRTLLEELEHGTLPPEESFSVTVTVPDDFTHYCSTCDEYTGAGHDELTAGTHDVERVL